MEKDELIPNQQIGEQTDAEKEQIFPSATEASIAYQEAVGRLLNVNEWHSSTVDAQCFKLYNKSGFPVDRTVQESDYIRINIADARTAIVKDFYWLCIESMERFSDTDLCIDFTLFVARPSRIPGYNRGEVTHFLSDRATSTFMVFRKDNVVSAEMHGRIFIYNFVYSRLVFTMFTKLDYVTI